MANGPFVDALARIEEALASILEFSVTTGNLGFIERMTRLAIKKEILMEMLLDEVDDGAAGECQCTGSVITSIPNTQIFVNGVTDVGDVTANIQICPDCNSENSIATFSFTDDTPTPTNNSFTFVATSVSPSTCALFSTQNQLSFSGVGVVTRADMTTINVSFNGTLFENTVPPGATDAFQISINSTEIGNPFNASFFGSSLADGVLNVEPC